LIKNKTTRELIYCDPTSIDKIEENILPLTGIPFLLQLSF